MRMYVSLYPDEGKALGELAQKERRDIRDQAALLIRRGLERAGMLPSNGIQHQHTDFPQAKEVEKCIQ